MEAASGGNERSLEQTPTWAVTVVCSGFVIISVLIEQAIHHVGTVSLCQHSLQFNILLRFCTGFGLLLFGIQHQIHAICTRFDYTNILPDQQANTNNQRPTFYYDPQRFLYRCIFHMQNVQDLNLRSC